MHPWASWTAKTAVLTLMAGLAATAGGLSGAGATVSQVVQRAVAGNSSTSRIAGPGGMSEPGTDGTSPHAPATRAGDTNVPAATQLAGLGALPGLADLPSSGGLASTPARNRAMGGGNPIPGSALSAASSGMSSDSFAALAVGALLAGASAVKIAGRRARDRKAGIRVAPRAG